MADKDEMLARIRSALGRAQSSAMPQALGPFSARPAIKSDDLAGQFMAELEKVAGRACRVSSTEQVKSYLAELLTDATATVAVSDSAVVRRAGLREWLEGRGATVLPTLAEYASSESMDTKSSTVARYKKALLRAAVGVTSADYAIADTGTLVIVSGGEQHRMISLVPPVHVCLLGSNRIVGNIADLIERVHEEYYLNDPPAAAVTFITGPSRTADIELSLTLGVHGPRELHVLLHSDLG
jgi:L-lactate dehydrogenase complex protein LldG